MVGMRAGQRFFNRFTLIRKLGQGGMGVVWLARDESLDHEVALKFLPDAAQRDPGAIDDLKRETKRALRLTHPGVVRVHDFIEAPEVVAISMEYIQGASLAEVLRQEPRRHFEVDDIKEWVRQLCETLAYAHNEVRVIHRDLKPGNILMDMRSRPHITDFGIARCLVDSLSRMSRSRSGTVSYMSPQQAMGEMPQASDDIYALGATIYEMLTGRAPFYSAALQVRFWDSMPPSMAARRVELGVSGQMIPLGWEETVAACLAKEPENRPSSTLEVWKRLNSQNGSTALNAAEPLTSGEVISAPEEKPVVVDTDVGANADVPVESGRSGLGWWLLTLVGLLVLFVIWWGKPKSPESDLKTANVLPSDVKVESQRPIPQSEVEILPKPRGEKPSPGNASRTAYIGNNVSLDLVWIQAGEFTMGSPKTEVGRDENEVQHRVTISKGFWLGKTEVTQRQYETIMGDNPSNFKSSGPDAPVEQVSWSEAMEFCQKLTVKERSMGGLPGGYVYRLPTEAQWEYACRAGTQGSHGGDLNAIAWYSDNSAFKTYPVRQKQANDWGLYDMHGNVWEWCYDWSGAYSLNNVIDPVGPNTGSGRINRGGSFGFNARLCRSAGRYWNWPYLRSSDLGFRVALIPTF